MKRRITALSLTLTLLLASSAFALDEAPVNAPTAGDITAVLSPIESVSVSGGAGFSVNFTGEDFLNALAPSGELLRGIVIRTLPSDGKLLYAGREILTREAVTAETLGSLSFVPQGIDAVNTSFDILPVYDTGISDSSVSVTVNLEKRENHPPVAKNIEVKTYKNIAATCNFDASDPENDALTYRVTSKPKRGEVTVTGEGQFVYTPYNNKTGSDSFTYVAIDPYGNTSAEATVSIKIEKPSTKTTYADMDGNPAYYAALRLTEAGIYTGEQICGQYYFKPDEVMTRAELITMVCRIVGLEEELTPVSATGFADDASIPVWFKPYAQLALKKGLISGTQGADGRKSVNSSGTVTFAEVAVILNKAIGMANVYSSADDVAVPAWAAQAAVNLDAVGVVKLSQTDWTRQITRADAAVMLSGALDVYKQTEKKAGLLSWVFGW